MLTDWTLSYCYPYTLYQLLLDWSVDSSDHCPMDRPIPCINSYCTGQWGSSDHCPMDRPIPCINSYCTGQWGSSDHCPMDRPIPCINSYCTGQWGSSDHCPMATPTPCINCSYTGQRTALATTLWLHLHPVSAATVLVSGTGFRHCPSVTPTPFMVIFKQEPQGFRTVSKGVVFTVLNVIGVVLQY